MKEKKGNAKKVQFNRYYIRALLSLSLKEMLCPAFNKTLFKDLQPLPFNQQSDTSLAFVILSTGSPPAADSLQITPAHSAAISLIAFRSGHPPPLLHSNKDAGQKLPPGELVLRWSLTSSGAPLTSRLKTLFVGGAGSIKQLSSCLALKQDVVRNQVNPATPLHN